jgi:hypothetical protein
MALSIRSTNNKFVSASSVFLVSILYYILYGVLLTKFQKILARRLKWFSANELLVNYVANYTLYSRVILDRIRIEGQLKLTTMQLLTIPDRCAFTSRAASFPVPSSRARNGEYLKKCWRSSLNQDQFIRSWIYIVFYILTIHANLGCN